jgi:hypothetical protein
MRRRLTASGRAAVRPLIAGEIMQGIWTPAAKHVPVG